MAKNNLVITGANGFLGRNIIRLAQRENWSITGVCRPGSSQGLTNILPASSILEHDLIAPTASTALQERLRGAVVINCAAAGVKPGTSGNISELIDTNVQGCANFYRLAADCSRFIHIGSCSEYATHTEPVREDANVSGGTLYGATKASGSLILEAMFHSQKTPLLICRLFHFWGPHESSLRLVPTLMRGFNEGTDVPLSVGTQVRDISYVEEIAGAVLWLASLDTLPSLEVINIGSGRPVTIRDFSTAISELFQKTHLLKFGAIPLRPNEPMYQVADVAKLLSYGWKITPMSLSDAIDKMLSLETKL